MLATDSEYIGGYIYKITAPNGKAYVGQHKFKVNATAKPHRGRVKLKLNMYSLQKRLKDHCKKGSNCVLLKRSITKYSWDNMSKEVLLRCAPEQLDSYEQAMIAAWDCMAPRGLNCTSGGESNKRLSEDLRRNISAGLARYYETHDNPNKGKPGRTHTAETKEKIARAMRGRSVVLKQDVLVKQSANTMSAAALERRKLRAKGSVSWHKGAGKFQASIPGSWTNSGKASIGLFPTEEDARVALAEYKAKHVLNSV